MHDCQTRRQLDPIERDDRVPLHMADYPGGCIFKFGLILASNRTLITSPFYIRCMTYHDRASDPRSQAPDGNLLSLGLLERSWIDIDLSLKLVGLSQIVRPVFPLPRRIHKMPALCCSGEFEIGMPNLGRLISLPELCTTSGPDRRQNSSRCYCRQQSKLPKGKGQKDGSYFIHARYFIV